MTNIDVANKEMNIFSFQLVQAFTVSMRVIIQKVLELAQSTHNALQCFDSEERKWLRVGVKVVGHGG